jgi:methylated-DNA-protein-cysteine methyltransferase-like protein
MPNLKDAPLYERIYAVICQVPPGKVSTYGQIAAIVGRSCTAREVGYALAALKAGDRGVPWQRVINSQGEISLPDEGGEIQRRLLEAEGIGFDARGRIDLDRFGWDGPDWEWLDQNDFNPAPLLRRTGKKGARGRQLSFL